MHRSNVFFFVFPHLVVYIYIYINCACAAYKLSAKSHKPGLMHYVSNDASAMATEGLAQISISYLEMYRDPC